MAEGGDNYEDFERIVGPDYNLVLKCSSPEQPACLFEVVHASVSRNAQNYSIVLQLAGEELPKKDTSSCELTVSHVHSNVSNGEMLGHFFWPGGDEPEIGDDLTEHSEVFTKPVEETVVPDQEHDHHKLQRHGGEVRDVLLTEQVRHLESELDNAHKDKVRQDENEILRRRLDKQQSELQQVIEQLKVRVAELERDLYLLKRQ